MIRRRCERLTTHMAWPLCACWYSYSIRFLVHLARLSCEAREEARSQHNIIPPKNIFTSQEKHLDENYQSPCLIIEGCPASARRQLWPVGAARRSLTAQGLKVYSRWKTLAGRFVLFKAVVCLRWWQPVILRVGQPDCSAGGHGVVWGKKKKGWAGGGGRGGGCTCISL